MIRNPGISGTGATVTKRCQICGEIIPKKTQDELMSLGYSGATIYSPIRATLNFCPKHTAKEISDTIAAIIPWEKERPEP